MMDHFINLLQDIPWKEVAPGARQKLYTLSQLEVRLLELTDMFEEEDWCVQGHVGYVLNGNLQLTFMDGIKSLPAGTIFELIGNMAGHQHKASVRSGEKTTLLLLEKKKS